MYQVGDILYCKYDYWVEVVEANDGLVGRLICEPTHSCYNIPYSLDGDYVLYFRGEQ
jgi:hypothetical protein